MNSFFELLDMESGNFMESYETEEQALHDLQRILQEGGPDELIGLALFRFEDNRPSLVARDEELIKRVQSINPVQRSRRAVGLT